MLQLENIFHFITSPIAIISAFGLLGIILIVFAETGLFFGFFLPGDSLLFTAGFLASQSLLPVTWLFIGVFIAAVIGDSVGYAFGRKIGPAIFTREDSFFFNKKYPLQAEVFYKKYGGRAILYARFIPIVRTFAPIIAGVGNMKYRDFIVYNISGGIIWTLLLTGAGYVLGNTIPHADSYITPIVIVIILISLIPPVFHAIKSYMISKNSPKI